VLDGTARCDVDGRTVRTFERGSYFGELAPDHRWAAQRDDRGGDPAMCRARTGEVT
jgi:hypothetical protein